MIAGGRSVGHKHRTQAKSDNVYVNLLVKVRASVRGQQRPSVLPSHLLLVISYLGGSANVFDHTARLVTTVPPLVAIVSPSSICCS